MSASQVRVVAWNCCGGFWKKADQLRSLQPDIAIISEVLQSNLSALGPDAQTAWIGDEGVKGLAIVGFNGWRITPTVSCEERLFLPAEATRGGVRLQLVGVHLLPAPDYVSPTLRALEGLSAALAGERVLLAGDFNQSVGFDPRRSEGRQFATVVRRLGDLGLLSLWHDHRGEVHGAESSPTIFHQHSEAKPYHVDYMFGSAALRTALSAVELGSYQDWVAAKFSDHVPLVATFNV